MSLALPLQLRFGEFLIWRHLQCQGLLGKTNQVQNSLRFIGRFAGPRRICPGIENPAFARCQVQKQEYVGQREGQRLLKLLVCMKFNRSL
jgi:hypothetical protein